jgi:hypothetical protein
MNKMEPCMTCWVIACCIYAWIWKSNLDLKLEIWGWSRKENITKRIKHYHHLFLGHLFLAQSPFFYLTRVGCWSAQNPACPRCHKAHKGSHAACFSLDARATPLRHARGRCLVGLECRIYPLLITNPLCSLQEDHSYIILIISCSNFTNVFSSLYSCYL